jgi:hypothetical protein
MLNWFDYLRRLAAWAAGPLDPPPGRHRMQFRPQVEGLEERQVPAGLTSQGPTHFSPIEHQAIH